MNRNVKLTTNESNHQTEDAKYWQNDKGNDSEPIFVIWIYKSKFRSKSLKNLIKSKSQIAEHKMI